MVAVGELARSRAGAKAEGRLFYFTGKPCANGHISIRYARGECVACTKENAERWHTDNPEKVKAKDARWRDNNPDKIEAKNRSKIENDRKARYNKRHPEVRRQIMVRWRAKNKDVTRHHARQRYALRKGATEKCSREELQALKKKARGRCWACGKIKTLTIDHMKALGKGGSDAIRNIQFLCRPCNSAKRDKDNEDFARSLGRLL